MVTKYHWALTKDVTAVTIDIPVKYRFRKRGLAYIQIYPVCKNQFDSGGFYPYADDDDSGVALALDDHTLNALFSKVGRAIPDRGTMRASWRHSGARITVPLASYGDRSYYVRIEIRMIQQLRDEVWREIERRRRESEGDTRGRRERECVFYIHPTAHINDFVTASTQVLARLYQEIISLSSDGKLGPDHQKIAILLFKLQQVSYAATNLRLYNHV